MGTVVKTVLKPLLRQRINVFSASSHRVRYSSSNARRLDLSGIYPPIATPFNDDETVAYDKLKENVDRWNKIPLKGFVVQGSNGEYVYLSAEERVDMVKHVTEMADKDKLIIAGSGCESTRDTIQMSQQMASAGARAVLIVTPCFYKGRMTDEALERHYTKVADESPVPIILYNVPANTGIDLSPDVIIRLSHHPNIIGLKDSAGNIAKIANLVYQTRAEDFQVLAGSADFLYPALSVGAVGGVCAFANILGAECCRLVDLFRAGKHAEAKLLQQRMVAPNAAVTRIFGVPGLKAAMSWFGYYGGPLRSPLQPLDSNELKRLHQTFVASEFLND